MKILVAIKSAAFRSLKIWKGILIVWISSLLLISMVAMPMKKAIKSGFGDSMITEKLADGINIEAFSDMGESLKIIASCFTAGFFMIILIGFILNSFFAGGLFFSLRGESNKFSIAEFFKASSAKFWPFLVISFIISLILIVLLILVIVVPVSVLSQSASSSDGSVFNNWTIFILAYLLLASIILLVADYARAWQASNEGNACFRAIGFGFSQTFRTFLSSYPLMIIILIVQFLFGWMIISILPGMKPGTGVGIFLLFLLSQSLFFIKVLLKSWRYGCVTSLMEQNRIAVKEEPVPEVSEYSLRPDQV
jgi:hypothetical protein